MVKVKRTTCFQDINRPFGNLAHVIQILAFFYSAILSAIPSIPFPKIERRIKKYNVGGFILKSTEKGEGIGTYNVPVWKLMSCPRRRLFPPTSFGRINTWPHINSANLESIPISDNRLVQVYFSSFFVRPPQDRRFNPPAGCLLIGPFQENSNAPTVKLCSSAIRIACCRELHFIFSPPLADQRSAVPGTLFLYAEDSSGSSS